MLAYTREHPIIGGLKTEKKPGPEDLPEWEGGRPAVTALVAVAVQQQSRKGGCRQGPSRQEAAVVGGLPE